MNLISFHLLEKFQRNYCFSNSKRCPKKLNIWFNETNSVLNNFPYGFRYKTTLSFSDFTHRRCCIASEAIRCCKNWFLNNFKKMISLI